MTHDAQVRGTELPGARAHRAGGPWLDAAGRAALSDVLRDPQTRGDIPAVFAIVVNRDDVLFLDAAGWRDVAGGDEARPDAIFRIASMGPASSTRTSGSIQLAGSPWRS